MLFSRMSPLPAGKANAGGNLGIELRPDNYWVDNRNLAIENKEEIIYMENVKVKNISRLSFLKNTGIVAAGLTFLPGLVSSKLRNSLLSSGLAAGNIIDYHRCRCCLLIHVCLFVCWCVCCDGA